MAAIVVNSANGTWSLDDLNSPDFANASISYQTTTTIIFTGTNGAGFSLTGDFSSSSPYNWTLNSLNITSHGATVFSISGFSMNFYTFATSSGSSLEASILSGSDTITSNMSSGQPWYAYGGDDTISLGSGNDTIDGGSGTDRLIISDSFANASATSSYGTLRLDSGDGLDRISGIEILEFANRTLAVTVGSTSSNSLQGDGISDLLHDLMLGGVGNDTLRGLSGNDVLIGEDGSDRLEGGDGLDQLNGGDGQDSLFGGDASDILAGHSDDDLLDGGRGTDKLFGGNGSDEIKGGNGNDFLRGGGGRDELTGGNGDDRLKGDGGKDILLGHKGDDRLTGGKQSDTFVFHKGHGNDTITDFTIGSDHIEIGRGASRLKHLDFSQQGDDVLVAFSNVTILVEDTTVAQLQDADNFLF